jgi:hypothetical protein
LKLGIGQIGRLELRALKCGALKVGLVEDRPLWPAADLVDAWLG